MNINLQVSLTPEQIKQISENIQIDPSLVDELLTQFPLDRKEIESVLKQNGGSVEASYVPLLEKLQEKEQREKKKTQEADKNKRLSAQKYLEEIFNTVSRNEIGNILDSVDGDVEAAVDKITVLLNEAEEPKNKKNENEPVIEAINDVLNIGKDNVAQLLDKHNGNKQNAISEFLQTKINVFKRSFKDLPEEIVEQVLAMNDYDTTTTTEALNQLLKNKYASVEHKPPQINNSPNHEEAKMNLVNSILVEVDKRVAENDPMNVLRETLRLQGPLMAQNIVPPQNNDKPVPAVEVKAPEPNKNAPFNSKNPINLDKSKWAVSVNCDSTHYDYGSKIIVKLPSVGVANSNDWVGFYSVDKDDRTYIRYEWVPKDGSLVFVAPSIPGMYEFRYFTNKTYNKVGVSQQIRVGPEFELTPIIVSDTLRQVKVVSKIVKGTMYCPNAWIGVYEPGKPNTEYLDYFWRDHGEPVFTLPKAGAWEFRMFPDKSYDYAATSTITIAGKDKIRLYVEKNNQLVIKYKLATVNPKNEYVWIGIYRADENNNHQYRRYKVVNTYEGEVRLKHLQTPGTYEARLFARQSWDHICTSSNTIVVELKMETF